MIMIGVDKNEEKAVQMYKLAAAQGYSAAQFNLGMMMMMMMMMMMIGVMMMMIIVNMLTVMMIAMF